MVLQIRIPGRVLSWYIDEGKFRYDRNNELNIPKLARGGVVNGPTTALIGEAGQEAVVPLENNTDWIDKIANKISSSICGGSDNGQPVTINIKLREETIASCVIDNINKMAKMNGYSPIII